MITNIRAFISEYTIAAAIIGFIGVCILAFCGLLGVVLTGVLNRWTGDVAAVELVIEVTKTAKANPAP